MMHYSHPVPLSATADAPAGLLQLAAAAYLARFTGSSREHTESDLRCYVQWCADRGLDPLPPAVGRAIDRAIAGRMRGPILLNRRGSRMDRHAAIRRPRQLAQQASMPIARPHPHMLRHTFVTTSYGCQG